MRYGMQKNVSKLIPALLILALLTLLLPATALAAPGDSLEEPEYITLVDGTLVILNKPNHYYRLTGNTNQVVQITANCTVILDGVNIAPGGGSALFIDDNCKVTVILKEGTTNILKGGTNSAGLRVWRTSELTLQGPGTLEATGGGLGGAGIGSSSGDSGTITITGGARVTATGGANGAGIGSGRSGSGGTITITGGAWVSATGAGDGAGIGGSSGSGGSGGTIRIEAATVKAQGGDRGGAGIGGGAGGGGGSIDIGAGADVTAVGGNGYQGANLSNGGGAGIGGGGGVGEAQTPTGGAAGRIEIDARAVISATGGKGGASTNNNAYSGGGAAIGGGGGGANAAANPSRYGAGGEADKSELILPAAWYTAPKLEGGAGGGGSAQPGAVIGTGGWADSATGANAWTDYVKEFFPDWPTVPLLYDYAPRYGGGLAQSGMTFYPTPSNASYTGAGELSFTVQADRRNFVAAYMDGTKLTEGEHFVLTDGSTILTLRESYLATLSSGTHKLRIVFHSGEGTATVTVGVGYVPEEIELDPPKTGGMASAWIGVLLVCLAGGAWMWLRRAR